VEGSADPHSQAEQGRVAYAFPSAPRWAWRELQDFIEYKAEAAGIQVIYINPAYSSKTCSICGCIGVRQKHTFSCSSCGHLAHSDHNAAVNR
jgi:transposase